MEQSTAVNFYKKGNSIGLMVSPICIPEKDAEGKLTGKTECNEHSHKPEDLTKMLNDLKTVLHAHGFETTVFGSLSSMQKSLTKKTGRVQHSEEAMIDFANSLFFSVKSPVTGNEMPIRVNSDDLAEWKEKYYAEGGK